MGMLLIHNSLINNNVYIRHSLLSFLQYLSTINSTQHSLYISLQKSEKDMASIAMLGILGSEEAILILYRNLCLEKNRTFLGGFFLFL